MTGSRGVAHGEHLARWAAEVQWEDLGRDLQSKVKSHILDTLGVMCAGVETPHGRAVQQVVRGWGGAAESTVVGRGWRLPVPAAAFLNAFHARAHTFDDTHETGPIHPGSAVVSAALASAETIDAPGPLFLAGVVAGYEVATRVSASVSPSHYARGFHNTGTCNTFGACAAAGRILGFDAETMIEALGFAGEGAAGLRQYQIDGSMADTSLDGARAAHTGIVAAQLRAGGLRGPRGILDGPWGFCRVLADDGDVSRLDHALGTTYEFAGTALKPFPSCRCTHGPVEALLAIRMRHPIDPHEVGEVTIAAFQHSVEVSDRPEIRTPFDAILSHQYCAAVALVKGGLTLRDFEEERLADPEVRAVAAKVRVVHDASLDRLFPASWPHRVCLTLRNGETFSEETEHAPGSAEHPLASALVTAKFLQLSEPMLGRRRADALRWTIESLDTIPNTRAITSLVRPEAEG
jgi:2-methylcitrate dehydratase PrpD